MNYEDVSDYILVLFPLPQRASELLAASATVILQQQQQQQNNNNNNNNNNSDTAVLDVVDNDGPTVSIDKVIF